MDERVKATLRTLDLSRNLEASLCATQHGVAQAERVLLRISKLERVLGLGTDTDFFSLRRVIDPAAIPIARDIARGHPFADLIRQRNILDSNSLRRVVRSHALQIPCYETGTIPAAVNHATDYLSHAWTRDAAIVAHALITTGHEDEGQRVLTNLAVFYARAEQRNRFLAFHFDADPVGRFRDRPHDLPHIRARIDESGRMVESEQSWSHSQLDALGMWLWATFRAARRGVLNLRSLNDFLSREINPDNAHDSLFSVALRSLHRLQFWDQRDHGPWEDHWEPQRASSIGICLAAFREAQDYFVRESWDGHGIYEPTACAAAVADAIVRAREALHRRIPPDGSLAVETDRFPTDAALTFLLYPFNPGLNGRQERAILRALYRDRMGRVGFTRRDNDEYLGMDHPTVGAAGMFCDPTVPRYRAAEWTLFDPLLASYFYDRYLSSAGLDDDSMLFADRHLRRSLLHVTPSADRYQKRVDSNGRVQVVDVPAGRVPEAYWYDSAEKRWRGNENTPLVMAEAAAAMMCERALEAARAAETRVAHGLTVGASIRG